MEKEYKLKHKKRGLSFSLKMLLATVAFASITSSSNGTFAQDTVNDNKNKTELFVDNAQNMSTAKTIVIDGSKGQKKNLLEITQTLNQSEYGRSVLLNADTTALKLIYDGQGDLLGYYHPLKHLIALNAQDSKNTQISFLAHELTHAKQQITGSANQAGMTLEEYIILYRAKEADACAGQVQACWELKQKGNDGPWKATLNTPYKDIALAYQKIAEKNPESVTNGTARREAYDQWFKSSWRLDGYDAQAIVKIKNILKEPGLTLTHFWGKEKVSSRFLIMGRLDNGSNYLVTGTARDTLENPFYSKNFSKENAREIEALRKEINKFFAGAEKAEQKTTSISEETGKNKKEDDNLLLGARRGSSNRQQRSGKSQRSNNNNQRSNNNNRPNGPQKLVRNSFPNARGRIIANGRG